MATAFQQTAGNLAQAQQDTEHAVAETVDSINTLSAKLQTLNKLASQGSKADSGLDAQIHSTLEELAQYVSFTAIEQDDGEVSVLLNSQTPLVVGDQQYALRIQFRQPESPPPLYPGAPGVAAAAGKRRIRYHGPDHDRPTGRATRYPQSRAAVVSRRCRPAGRPESDGGAIRVAGEPASDVGQRFGRTTAADRRPTLHIRRGDDERRAQYDGRPDARSSRSYWLRFNPVRRTCLTAFRLALSSLASPRDSADEIDGASFNQFYGRLAAGVGSALDDANSRLAVQQSAVAQSKNLRDQMSGVSLDEEASILIQFQRAYEANSRLISVLDQLTEDAINILQP